MSTKALERKLHEEARKAVQSPKIPEWLQGLVPKRHDIVNIILNPHGGINPQTKQYVTPGKRSPVWDNNPEEFLKNVYYEGAGCRLINAQYAKFLDFLGIPYIFPNDTWKDTPIHVKRKAVGDLNINRSKAFATEIHNNSSPPSIAGKGHGIEIYTLPGLSVSDQYATIQLDEAKKEFPDTKLRTDYWSDGDPDKEANWGILKIDKYYGIPTTLDEWFFMDNKHECKTYLMTEEGRYRIAKAKTIAAVKFINTHF